MNKREVIKKVKNLISTGNREFSRGKLKFENIEIRFTLRGKTAGKAHYVNDDNMTLWFHPQLMARNPVEYENTIAHEVAHLYQRKLYPLSKPHGREFKYVGRKLGNNGERCHDMNTQGIGRAKKRYVYTCPNGCTEHLLTEYKHKIQQKKSQLRKYICAHCKEDLTWTKKEKVIY